MNRRILLNLIAEGEGLKVEFKQRFSTHEKIAKEIIAFANTRGGHILFGIDDDKSIYGLQSEKSEAELIKQTVDEFCEPKIEYKISYFELDDKEIVAVEIPESKFKPHRIQDYQPDLDLNTAQVYVRVNDKSVLASKEMIKIMQVQSSERILKNYKIGKNEKKVFEFLDSNETINVKQLSDIANISYRRASRTLINLVRTDLLVIHTKDNGEEYFTYSGL
ncbi:MAG: ATP-binding protein [Melioribacteraceae bacterium]|nr:ATP-binding protein [Melioribacteraceae bacterium]MCF8355857.1 ATP-binding protein [Melioribacteraceae bacterium]MCF8393301.1 ATP-binding protein [Melioribacteraceae bacterium]MCF8419153.1 ATP-binding protein [Melioribacteraceae bacterium]